jgi:hypothetical protein
MKTLLLAFSILLAFPVFGQNYRTVLTDSEVYFDFKENGYGFLNIDVSFNPKSISRVIVTDSFQIINSDTVIYQQFNQEFEITKQTVYDSSSQMYVDCDFYNVSDTGFLGYKTILKADGTDVYFNRFNDSIFIQTQANVNDSWIFYQSGSNVYYEATVTNIANENFLGISDNVKTITLQAKDSLGNNISSPYDTLELKISENYGLVKGFNLFRFPEGVTFDNRFAFTNHYYNAINILGHSKDNLGIKNLTAADIYDYDIGDEYHWLYSNSDYSSSGFSGYSSRTYNLITINDKYFSADGDTVYYDVYLRKLGTFYSQINPVNTTYSYNTIYIGDTTINYYIGENDALNTYSLHKDNQAAWIQAAWIQTADGTKKRALHQEWSINDCYQEGEIRSGGSSTFHKGIGHTWTFAGVSIPTERMQLLYYDKSGNTWGTPVNIYNLFTVSTEPTIKEDFNLKVFPNPTNKLLNFQFTEPIDNAEIRIYSSIGQLMTNQNIRNTDVQFEVSDWSSGVYFYGVYVEGVLVKQGQVLIED